METVAQNMVAMRISTNVCMAIVGTPTYFRNLSPPTTPHDLTDHSCLNPRYAATSGWVVWEFEKAGHGLRVRIHG